MTEFIRIAGDHNEKEKDFRLQKILKEAENIPANPFRIKVWIVEEVKKLI